MLRRQPLQSTCTLQLGSKKVPCMVAAMQGTENYQIWQRRSDTCKGSILFPHL